MSFADQLARHDAKLASSAVTSESASHHEQKKVAALQAEIASLYEAMAGKKQQSAALADVYTADMARFAELRDIVVLH